ncbi:hypothetical protein MH116_06425 [Bacillus pumilus]|uniref:hypothetical protein n=1 Tax=Bacillus pumilus TaxID=1408 RepID=UPI0022830DD2|nr:hypothetical protein [Bacillus pumilus]MCY7617510.1 hypothetical protein [Bacillus pumilus]
MKGKKIGISHFVYACIIALLIILFISVFAFGGNEDAGNQVNVMATGISIILAVIAILMTLVDVAGQRQSIIDIKETAEKLAKSQSISQETIKKSIEALDELVDFRKELLKSVSDYKNGTEELIHQLFEKGEQSISKEELQELLNKFNKKTSDLESKVQKISTVEYTENIRKQNTIKTFKQWIRSRYRDESKVDSDHFFDEVNLTFSVQEYNTIKDYMELNSYVYYDTEEKGEYVDLEEIKRVEYRETMLERGFRPII